MLKRLISVFAVLIVVLIAAAAYFLYAPKPALPSGPAEASTVEVGGRQRHYLVITPARLQAGASVLLVFHPSLSSGEDMRRMVGSALEGIAQRENVVVVYPDGYEGHFNDCRRVASFSARKLNIDDVGFSKRIIERLAAEKKIDPERVYAMGVSNGGHMALRLALEAPELVKGVAAIAANLPAPDNMDCKVAPSPSRFIEFVEGTKDPINPYGGGQVTLFGFGNRGNVLSAQESAQWFAHRLGLAATEPQTLGKEVSGISAHQQDWRSANGHVRLVTIEGGGHTVPQASYRSMRILGATFQSDSVLESMWQLLAENNH
ncbi:MAG: prolyl oligopeptidase family serine peptidase [Acidobacteria bacterium]|nr:prolyl oligopeptidase family serine peptidase [Acidobacteriota bacterium]